MNNNNDKVRVIDLRLIFDKTAQHKKVFFVILPTVLILSYLLILAVPRTYTSSTVMAPELGAAADMSSLGDIASSFGIDLPSGQNVDAISPLLYPDLMNDNGFVTQLFQIQLTTLDGSVQTSYYNYLLHHTDAPWWTKMMVWIRTKVSSPKPAIGLPSKFDPYHLSKLDNDIAGAIRNSVSIMTDKKTGVITITAQSQDPMVSKIIADSTRSLLKSYIINYRTSKARNDVAHYTTLVASAKHDYERVRQSYGAFSDANTDVLLESVRAKQEDLENDMQLKYNAYSALVAQLNAAKTKLQDSTPVFTMIQGAEVPVKASGPKRMVFALGMTLLFAILLTLWYTRDIILTDHALSE